MAARRLNIVGGGIEPSAHLTLAGYTAACESAAILSIMPQSWVDRLPEPLRSRTRSHWNIYLPGRLRRDVYADYVTVVLDEFSRHEQVTHICSGSPLWYDTIVGTLIAREIDGEYETMVYAGVSSIEAIVTDLRLAVAPGIMVIDAASILGGAMSPNTGLPCILTQPSVLSTAFVATEHTPRASALVPLRDALLAHYPGTHPLFIVRAHGAGSASCHPSSIMLDRLADVNGESLQEASILIPPMTDISIGAAEAVRAHDRAAFASDYRPVR